MTTTYTDERGDEITAADFDDYVPLAYKRTLARHPDCRDPDHPGCDKCMDDNDAETPDINEEPVPYTDNAPAQLSVEKHKLTIKPLVEYIGKAHIVGGRAWLVIANDGHPNLPRGSEVTTSAVLDWDADSGRIETKNTVYIPEVSK